MDFKSMDIGTIIDGVGGDGVRYLETFLKEYTSLFSETVNPGCTKCLTQYLDKYKNHFKAMENTSKYRLHPKYEGIPLEFGSPILVNNGNITDEYAEKLLVQDNGVRYFEKMPEGKPAKKLVSKEEVPVLTLEKLQANLKEAEDHLKSLGEKPHHKKLEAAQNKIDAAKKAIENFTPDNTLEKTSGTLELEISQEDIDRVPEFTEMGLIVGSKVIVNAEQYGIDGEITIANIVTQEK